MRKATTPGIASTHQGRSKCTLPKWASQDVREKSIVKKVRSIKIRFFNIALLPFNIYIYRYSYSCKRTEINFFAKNFPYNKKIKNRRSLVRTSVFDSHVSDTVNLAEFFYRTFDRDINFRVAKALYMRGNLFVKRLGDSTCDTRLCVSVPTE